MPLATRLVVSPELFQGIPHIHPIISHTEFVTLQLDRADYVELMPKRTKRNKFKIKKITTYLKKSTLTPTKFGVGVISHKLKCKP